MEEQEGIRRLTKKRALNGPEACQCLQYGGGGYSQIPKLVTWTCVVDGKPEESSATEACITGGRRHRGYHPTVRTAMSGLWTSMILSKIVSDQTLKLLKQNPESK